MRFISQLLALAIIDRRRQVASQTDDELEDWNPVKRNWLDQLKLTDTNQPQSLVLKNQQKSRRDAERPRRRWRDQEHLEF